MDEDEAMMIWQDVLDLIASGRTTDLKCPFCKTGAISVEQRERKTRIQCSTCRKFIEGRFGEEQ
jgi:hypothetical protein